LLSRYLTVYPPPGAGSVPVTIRAWASSPGVWNFTYAAPCEEVSLWIPSMIVLSFSGDTFDDPASPLIQAN